MIAVTAAAKNYYPKHPTTKRLLKGGFDPIQVSSKPFGLRRKLVVSA